MCSWTYLNFPEAGNRAWQELLLPLVLQLVVSFLPWKKEHPFGVHRCCSKPYYALPYRPWPWTSSWEVSSPWALAPWEPWAFWPELGLQLSPVGIAFVCGTRGRWWLIGCHLQCTQHPTHTLADALGGSQWNETLPGIHCSCSTDFGDFLRSTCDPVRMHGYGRENRPTPVVEFDLWPKPRTLHGTPGVPGFVHDSKWRCNQGPLPWSSGFPSRTVAALRPDLFCPGMLDLWPGSSQRSLRSLAVDWFRLWAPSGGSRAQLGGSKSWLVTPRYVRPGGCSCQPGWHGTHHCVPGGDSGGSDWQYPVQPAGALCRDDLQSGGGSI